KLEGDAAGAELKGFSADQRLGELFVVVNGHAAQDVGCSRGGRAEGDDVVGGDLAGENAGDFVEREPRVEVAGTAPGRLAAVDAGVGARRVGGGDQLEPQGVVHHAIA